MFYNIKTIISINIVVFIQFIGVEQLSQLKIRSVFMLLISGEDLHMRGSMSASRIRFERSFLKHGF